MSMRSGAMVLFVICIFLGLSTALPAGWQGWSAGLLALCLAATMIYCIGRRWRTFTRRITVKRIAYLLLHTGFILLVLAGLIGSQGSDFSLKIAEGQTIDLTPYGFVFSVRADQIEAEYYPGGIPRQYYTTLTFLENGAAAGTGTTSVNHPASHRGLYFYQSAYSGMQGKVSVLQVKTRPEQAFLWTGLTILGAGALLWPFRKENTA